MPVIGLDASCPGASIAPSSPPVFLALDEQVPGEFGVRLKDFLTTLHVRRGSFRRARS